MIKNFTSVFRFFVSGIVLLSLFFSGSADLSAQDLSSQDIKLTYERDASNSITEKDQKYFIEIENLSHSSKNLAVAASLISCNDGTYDDAEVSFEVLTISESELTSLSLPASGKVKFILKTTKLDLDAASWSCVDVKIYPVGGAESSAVSFVIKQLNPGNSNSK
ncbi:hypothetical protein [Leeuwenhoekiella marinoflava]|nr:hypothetical protein [Leeuwenhoekiella marinoflava]